MSSPRMIFLFYDDDNYEDARNFCFERGFDMMEELIAGDNALLLYKSEEIHYLMQYCDEKGIIYSAYDNLHYVEQADNGSDTETDVSR